MVTTFQNATFLLNLAKRQEAKEIAESYEKKLTEERAHKMEAENKAAAATKGKEVAEKREQELLAELEAQKAAVAEYRAQLASAIRVGPQSDSPASSQRVV